MIRFICPCSGWPVPRRIWVILINMPSRKWTKSDEQSWYYLRSTDITDLTAQTKIQPLNFGKSARVYWNGHGKWICNMALFSGSVSFIYSNAFFFQYSSGRICNMHTQTMDDDHSFDMCNIYSAWHGMARHGAGHVRHTTGNTRKFHIDYEWRGFRMQTKNSHRYYGKKKKSWLNIAISHLNVHSEGI